MSRETKDTEAHVPLLPELDSPAEKRGSVSGAVFNVSTSIIGAGIMSIPATLKVLGVIPALALIVLIAMLVDISVEFMLRFTYSGDSITYAGLMKESFGRLGSVLVQICVMITNLGCLIIYLIIIGKHLHHLNSFLILFTLQYDTYLFFWFCMRSDMRIFSPLASGNREKGVWYN